jgi:hypothetical protein
MLILKDDLKVQMRDDFRSTLQLLKYLPKFQALGDNFGGDPLLQADVSLEIFKHMQEQLLLDTVPCRLRALIRGRSAPDAHIWLTVLPLPHLAYDFDPIGFQLLLKYHFGMSFLDHEIPCPSCMRVQDKAAAKAANGGGGGRFYHNKYNPKLGKFRPHVPSEFSSESTRSNVIPTMDIYLEHAIHCPCNGDRILKHDSLVRTFANYLKKKLRVRTDIEQRDSSGNKTRPHDVRLTCIDGDKELSYDFSVVATCCKTYVQNSAKEALYAAELRYKAKLSEIEKKGVVGLKPLPFIIESVGGLHPKASAAIYTIATRTAGGDVISVKSACKDIKTLLSVTLQKQNSLVLKFHYTDIFPVAVYRQSYA